MGSSHIIALFSLVGNILYVHLPPRVSLGYVCLSENKTEKWPDCYKPMLVTKINKDHPALMYKIDEEYKIEDVYFKILYEHNDGTHLKSTWFHYNEKCSCNFWYIYIFLCIALFVFLMGVIYLLIRIGWKI